MLTEQIATCGKPQSYKSRIHDVNLHFYQQSKILNNSSYILKWHLYIHFVFVTAWVFCLVFSWMMYFHIIELFMYSKPYSFSTYISCWHFLKFLFVWVFVENIYLLNALRGQKRPPNPLVLELQRIMSYHVCSGNQNQVVWKSSQCSWLLSHPASPFPSSLSSNNHPTAHSKAWDILISPLQQWSTQSDGAHSCLVSTDNHRHDI